MIRIAIVLVWLALSTAATVYLVMSLDGPGRSAFVPGTTTSGHYQIEESCETCHEPGGGVSQDACIGCHGDQLEEADDSHPVSKFLDPRNASLRHRVDGRSCVHCHAEHRPGVTVAMGATRPVDFCRECHSDIGNERPTHKGLPFASCQSAGCHNYHDNRGLAESLIADHMDDADTLGRPTVATLDPESRYRDIRRPALTRAQADMPPGMAVEEAVMDDWLATAHARAGVNCTACHGGDRLASSAGGGEQRPWTDHPGPEACRACHEYQVDGFKRGKHGMRHGAGLSAMTPGQARLPMRAEAANESLSCTSCHGAHRFDVRHAAVDACLGCHTDEHSLAYEQSGHYRRWQQEQRGEYWAGSGVSCATCHMPRVRRLAAARPGVVVEHDQNAVTRPVEAMVKPVCLSCHGWAFSVDALADRALIDDNFNGRVREGPGTRSRDMVRTHRARAADEDQP